NSIQSPSRRGKKTNAIAVFDKNTTSLVKPFDGQDEESTEESIIELLPPITTQKMKMDFDMYDDESPTTPVNEEELNDFILEQERKKLEKELEMMEIKKQRKKGKKSDPSMAKKKKFNFGKIFWTLLLSILGIISVIIIYKTEID